MEPKEYLEMFFATRKNPVTDKNRQAFEHFCNEEKNIDAVIQILSQQETLMKQWEIKTRIDKIINQYVLIPNGSVNKPYQATLDFEQLNWQEIIAYEIEGLEDIGLVFDVEHKVISGTPSASGDFKISFMFRISGEEEKEDWNLKTIPLIINPDPKSLWKDNPSDKEDKFWKPDNVAVVTPLVSKQIVVASKRGRSHANVGSFRDDDFAFKHFVAANWSVVAVSDGAGSAKYSREGARIACESVIDYFSDKEVQNRLEIMDTLLEHISQDADYDIQKEISQFIYSELGNAAKHAHHQLEHAATVSGATLSDFHATLIFVLIKKYEFGYGILSFGVGDCPIGLLHERVSAITMMNTLDVGEFGGGTRFITMPEIFQNENFSSRFAFKLVKDFDYLMLMTDGIYDPKFEVEANLLKIEKWQSFLEDLNGKNADGKAVILKQDNEKIADQLSDWMDFWSPGNHDDRTLAIIF
jgi:serine/threonine protein phosphatase PrpC